MGGGYSDFRALGRHCTVFWPDEGGRLLRSGLQSARLDAAQPGNRPGPVIRKGMPAEKGTSKADSLGIA